MLKFLVVNSTFTDVKIAGFPVRNRACKTALSPQKTTTHCTKNNGFSRAVEKRVDAFTEKI